MRLPYFAFIRDELPDGTPTWSVGVIAHPAWFVAVGVIVLALVLR